MSYSLSLSYSDQIWSYFKIIIADVKIIPKTSSSSLLESIQIYLIVKFYELLSDFTDDPDPEKKAIRPDLTVKQLSWSNYYSSIFSSCDILKSKPMY